MEVLILHDHAGQVPAAAIWRRLHANGVDARLSFCSHGHPFPSLVTAEMRLKRPTLVGLFCNQDILSRASELRDYGYSIADGRLPAENARAAFLDTPDAWSNLPNWGMLGAFLRRSLDVQPVTLAFLDSRFDRRGTPEMFDDAATRFGRA